MHQCFAPLRDDIGVWGTGMAYDLMWIDVTMNPDADDDSGFWDAATHDGQRHAQHGRISSPS